MSGRVYARARSGSGALRRVGWLGGAIALAIVAPAQAVAPASTAEPDDRFVTLGTAGGPDAQPERSQPANLLVSGEDAYLVDVGDGAAGQLAKVNFPLARITGVFLSHLHFDHSGGLLAVLALRFQMNVTKPLRVLGPPGTKEFVDDLLTSMRPEARIESAGSGATPREPGTGITTTELLDGDAFTIGQISLKIRANSHYPPLPNRSRAARSASLSFRFDLPKRSIVYTGDTGPSRAVEELSSGAHLLVAEMIDVERMEIRLKQFGLSDEKFKQLMSHMRDEHLTAEAVGDLGSAAGVKTIAVTHLVGLPPPAIDEPRYIARIRTRFSGKVFIAQDLASF